MGEILVIKLSALGDLVQADGAMRDIREHHRRDRITVMTTPQYRRYMDRCPWVDAVFVDPRAARYDLSQMFQLRRRLHELTFDRVYDLQQVGRTRFYYRWLFPRTEWLGDARGCTYFLERPVPSCAADHFARHLQMAGIKTRHTLATDVSWMADEVDDLLAAAGLEPGYIMLIPGASAAHEEKRWPHFSALAARLLDCGLRVVTVPGPADMELCRTIPGDMLTGVEGYHDFFVLAGIAKRAACVIGNDTGPVHIAAHLNCPGLALYGGHTAPLTTGIQHTRFRWLEAHNLADLPIEDVWQVLVNDLGMVKH